MDQKKKKIQNKIDNFGEQQLHKLNKLISKRQKKTCQ